MRIILTFNPIEKIPYNKINKFTIQGLIYKLLDDDEELKQLHDKFGYKYFNFSNIFPLGDYNENANKKLIISSPDKRLINTLYSTLMEKEKFYLNEYEMNINNIKLLKNNKFNKTLETGTPIAIQKNNDNNWEWFTFRNNINFDFFKELKENALRKYNSYYNTDFDFEGDLFKKYSFIKDVAIPLKHHENKFHIFGTIWKNLEFNPLIKNTKFTEFLYDTGIGEKNSLGFGFLNYVR